MPVMLSPLTRNISKKLSYTFVTEKMEVEVWMRVGAGGGIVHFRADIFLHVSVCAAAFVPRSWQPALLFLLLLLSLLLLSSLRWAHCSGIFLLTAAFWLFYPSEFLLFFSHFLSCCSASAEQTAKCFSSLFSKKSCFFIFLRASS